MNHSHGALCVLSATVPCAERWLGDMAWAGVTIAIAVVSTASLISYLRRGGVPERA